ncbi:hypothetical protein Pelo_18072 [Pelomyxa schiedti]|nr:hypothetical protein Pelo_18072 [Pelomyxa schiedti]
MPPIYILFLVALICFIALADARLVQQHTRWGLRQGQIQRWGLKSQGQIQRWGLKSQGQTQRWGLKSQGQTQRWGVKSQGQIQRQMKRMSLKHVKLNVWASG